jgi:hypothetical protein
MAEPMEVSPEEFDELFATAKFPRSLISGRLVRPLPDGGAACCTSRAGPRGPSRGA